MPESVGKPSPACNLSDRAKHKIFLFFLLHRPPHYKSTLHNLLRYSICFKLSQTASLTAVFSFRFDLPLQLVSVPF